MSKQETAFIKGVGMLLILFHNYAHFIQPWGGENEFTFSSNNAAEFLYLIRQNPADITRLLFAFWGHYGVQLFVFVSGYGLFLSYKERTTKWLSFLKKHIIKLLPTLFLAICLLFTLSSIIHQKLPNSYDLKYAVLDLLFIQNFFPSLVYELSGPWWFFSLIVQLYAVFPFILAAFKRHGVKAIIATGICSWIITVSLNPFLSTWHYNLNYLFISRLPIFCLGMLFAWATDFKLPNWIIPVSVVILIGGNLSKYIWPFTMLAATILLLAAIRWTMSKIGRSKILTPFILWVGVNSLFIFAVHGFLRMPFVRTAEVVNNPLATIALGIAFLFVSITAAIIIKKTENIIQTYVSKFI